MIGKMQDTDVRLLRVFQAVAQCGGFSAAEVLLNRTQSTISSQMLQLEQRLGMRLCDRGQAGFQLTSDGEAVLEATEKLLAALDDFRNDINERSVTIRGDLRLGVNDNIAGNPQCKLHSAIAAFRDEASRVCIDIYIGDASQLESRVLDGRLHFGIGIFHHRLPSLSYHSLFAEEHALYCGRENPLFPIADKDVEPSELEKANYVSWGYLESFKPLKPKFRLTEVASSTYVEAAAIMVRSGRFVAYLPVHFARESVERGELRMIKPELTKRQVNVHLITRKGMRHSRAGRCFFEHLLKLHKRPLSRTSLNYLENVRPGGDSKLLGRKNPETSTTM